jgi:hypothetical protein
LRVGGIVVAAVLALLLSSWTSLLVIALVLAAYEILVTVAARSGRAAQSRPAPPAVEATAAGVS